MSSSRDRGRPVGASQQRAQSAQWGRDTYHGRARSAAPCSPAADSGRARPGIRDASAPRVGTDSLRAYCVQDSCSRSQAGCSEPRSSTFR